jgi:hypothetical protein
MRMILNVLAVLLILTGIVWFLQGVEILPGSFMTGRPEWAVYGGISAFAGIGLRLLALRVKG